MKRLVAALVASVIAGPLTAQSGPWTDGELIIRTVLPDGFTSAIYRMAPETGHGQVLVSGFFWGNPGGGAIAFDPHRDGLLANISLPPQNPQVPHLYLIKHDGSAVPVPGFDGQYLHAMAPVGDGRVYFQKHNDDEISYLDANDQVQTLMDATGAAPYQLDVEHLLYDAASDSLLASMSGWYSSATCAPGESSIYRIPLSPDGSQVGGPVACGSMTNVPNTILYMEHLPGGDVLLAMEGDAWFHNTLRRLDTTTLTTTTWAIPAQEDMAGGVWSARIGKAIVLDEWKDELRTFGPGESGEGTLLPADFIVAPPTTGYGPTESMIQLDLDGPGCIGTSLAFGAGLAGAGGFVPTMDTVGCPDLGNPFTLSIDSVVGGAPGLLAFGFAQTALPFAGGTLYVFPIATTVAVTASGFPGAAGAGAVGFNLTITDPSFVGLPFYMQAGFVDAAAVQDVSLTNALLLSIG